MIEFRIIEFASFYGAGGEAGLAVIDLMVMMVVAILGNGYGSCSFWIICVGRVVATVIVGSADSGCVGGFWFVNATTGTI